MSGRRVGICQRPSIGTVMPWRGEVAFEDEALAFRGESAENRFHAHAAVQCVYAAGGVRIRDADGTCFDGVGWVIQSGTSHCLEPAPSITLLLIEPQSRLAAALLDAAADQPIAAIPEDTAAALTVDGALSHALATFKRQVVGPQPVIDRRIVAALDRLDVITNRDVAAAAAASAGISPSRLRALCRAQFGVPFAKLVLWRKVRRACVALNIGRSLAQAAADAGFSDQAHLTRTMVEVIGLTPGVAAHAAE